MSIDWDWQSLRKPVLLEGLHKHSDWSRDVIITLRLLNLIDHITNHAPRPDVAAGATAEQVED